MDISYNLCKYITSVDLLEYILGFRHECFIQELVDQIIQYYEVYRGGYDEYLSLRHYYESYIIRMFHGIISTPRHVVGFQELIQHFRTLHGFDTYEYQCLNIEFTRSKRVLDEFTDEQSFNFCTESVLQIQNYNQTHLTRKTLTLNVLQTTLHILKAEIERLSTGIQIVHEYTRHRMHILQFVIRWVYIHTVESWTFWFMRSFKTPLEIEIYDILYTNRSRIRHFLELKMT